MVCCLNDYRASNVNNEVGDRQPTAHPIDTVTTITTWECDDTRIICKHQSNFHFLTNQTKKKKRLWGSMHILIFQHNISVKLRHLILIIIDSDYLLCLTRIPCDKSQFFRSLLPPFLPSIVMQVVGARI